MATSGTYGFIATRDTDIIYPAYRKIRTIDDNATLTTNQITIAAKMLDYIVQSWRADGVYLWEKDEVQIPFVASTIIIGTDGFDYQCVRKHTSTTTNKPITGSDWTSYWIPLGTTGVGVAWALSQSYVSVIQVTLSSEVVGIESPFIRTSNYDQPINLFSRENYMELGSKYSFGQPTGIYFNRRLGASELWVYPIPTVLTDVIHFTAIKRLQDIGAAGDNPDLPVEWTLALIDELAYRLSGNKDIPLRERQLLMTEAAISKSKAKGEDTENMGFTVSPNFNR